MPKEMTKAQMQEQIDKLKERLNDSTDAYMDLQRRYNDLNEKKGNIVAFEQLKEQYRQLEIRYDNLKDISEHERKHKEQLKNKYQKLYTEHEKLKNQQSSKDNNCVCTENSMVLCLREMYEEKLQEVKEKIYELNSILQKLVGTDGITMRIDNLDDVNYLYIAYNEAKINRKQKRNAGRKRNELIFIKTKISPQEARERMKMGETAEDIAKEIGISRAYFFRKLKEAEANNYLYIGWTSDDYAIEEDSI